MALDIGLGLSTQANLRAAVQDALQDARRGVDKPSAVLFFATFNYAQDAIPDALAAIRACFGPDVVIAGGTVNGLTYGDDRFDAVFANRHAAAIVAIGGVRVQAAIAPDATGRAAETGASVATQIRELLGEQPRSGILLTPGLSAGAAMIDQDILDGIRTINPRLRMSGSGLSGGMRPDGSFEPGLGWVGERIERLATVLIAFGKPVTVGFAAANGMRALGPGGFVTELEGPFIKQIDGRPAKDVCLDLLVSNGDPELRRLLEKNPTVVSVERGTTLGAGDPEGDFYWCHVPMTFTPDGWMLDSVRPSLGMALSVVSVDRQRCMHAVAEAAGMLREDCGAEEFDLVLAFSCCLRGFTLGAEISHEDRELRKALRAKHQLGLIANGEVGCHRHGRPRSTAWVYALFGLIEER